MSRGVFPEVSRHVQSCLFRDVLAYPEVSFLRFLGMSRSVSLEVSRHVQRRLGMSRGVSLEVSRHAQ